MFPELASARNKMVIEATLKSCTRNISARRRICSFAFHEKEDEVMPDPGRNGLYTGVLSLD